MRVCSELSAAVLRAPAPDFFFGAAPLLGAESGAASGFWLASPGLVVVWMAGVSSIIARW
jgi:hypothetical protein